MQNENLWKHTKFVKSKNSFRITKDTSITGIGYRLLGDLQAKFYSEMIKKNASGKLLDLGCGNVPLYEMYKPLVDSIYCADWPNSLHSELFVDFQMNLNQPFPLKNNLFDTIILTDVLEHIANPENVWKEVARVLKTSGKVLLAVPFFHPLHEEPYDYFRYTEFRLRLYCEENNLKIIELIPYGGSLEIFFDFTAKHLSRFKVLTYLYCIFAKLVMNSILGKKIYKLTSAKYPLGYCLVAEK